MMEEEDSDIEENRSACANNNTPLEIRSQSSESRKSTRDKRGGAGPSLFKKSIK